MTTTDPRADYINNHIDDILDRADHAAACQRAIVPRETAYVVVDRATGPRSLVEAFEAMVRLTNQTADTPELLEAGAVVLSEDERACVAWVPTEKLMTLLRETVDDTAGVLVETTIVDGFSAVALFYLQAVSIHGLQITSQAN